MNEVTLFAMVAICLFAGYCASYMHIFLNAIRGIEVDVNHSLAEIAQLRARYEVAVPAIREDLKQIGLSIESSKQLPAGIYASVDADGNHLPGLTPLRNMR